MTRTGNRTYAGTNANVFLMMFGKLGKSTEVQLDDEKDNFEAGMIDDFKVRTKYVVIYIQIHYSRHHRSL